MRFLEKSRSIANLDSVAYDLEDSVTPTKKPEGTIPLSKVSSFHV
jgi:citrate lyase subunit beta-like protein